MLDAQPTAALVYDGQFHLPKALGEARADQLQGTVSEKLCEAAGRTCYDSLGRGRNSEEYHTHVLEVGHLSVYEHYYLSVEVTTTLAEGMWRLLGVLINRPGLWVQQTGEKTLRVTYNLRTALEWDRWKPQFRGLQDANDFLYTALVGSATSYAPLVVRTFEPRQAFDWEGTVLAEIPPQVKSEDETWLSLLVSGSRGFSHELVRHGDFTAISQRSTRYVDEGESDWVIHPLIHAFLDDTNGRDREGLEELVRMSKSAYGHWVQTLQVWLQARDVPALNARKQARGAARGLLGNALETSLVFSANVRQWRWMMGLRAHPAADAEIRILFNRCLEVLQSSAHRHRFSDIAMVPAEDGLGEVMSE